MDTDFVSFQSELLTLGLQPGRHYKVCADIDGVGDLRMVDSLQEAKGLTKR